MTNWDFKTPCYMYSFEDIVRDIILGKTTESIVLDFKEKIDLGKNRSKLAEEIALDICQFLNGWGGVILVGIKESECEKTRMKVASEFSDAGNYEDVSKFINDSVIPVIYPKDISIDVNQISGNNGVNIISINVRPLIVGLSCVTQISPPYSSKFPYRTHYGKKYLSPFDVSSRMSRENRKIPLTLNEIGRKTKTVKLYPEVDREEAGSAVTWEHLETNIFLKEISTTEYTITICGVDVNIPYSLTEDVWKTEHDEIGILLKAKLIISSNRKKIKIVI